MKGSHAVAVGIAVLAAILVAKKVSAGEMRYVCPVDELEFLTQEELITHMQLEHPGVRIPVKIMWS